MIDLWFSATVGAIVVLGLYVNFYLNKNKTPESYVGQNMFKTFLFVGIVIALVFSYMDGLGDGKTQALGKPTKRLNSENAYQVFSVKETDGGFLSALIILKEMKPGNFGFKYKVWEPWTYSIRDSDWNQLSLDSIPRFFTYDERGLSLEEILPLFSLTEISKEEWEDWKSK